MFLHWTTFKRKVYYPEKEVTVFTFLFLHYTTLKRTLRKRLQFLLFYFYLDYFKEKSITLRKRRIPMLENPTAASQGRIWLMFLKTPTQVLTNPRPGILKKSEIGFRKVQIHKKLLEVWKVKFSKLHYDKLFGKINVMPTVP